MQQTPAHAPPPAAPLPSAVIAPGRVGAPAIPIPLTSQQVDALRERVSELAGQRSAVNSQRRALAEQLRSARAGADQAGLEAHIAALDARDLTIESDIADLGKALSAAPNGLSETTTSTAPAANHGPFNSGQATAVTIVGTIFVLAPMAIAAGMIAMRRFAHPAAPQIPREVAERLERMDQGIEAVALEIERIGEGQRFVTQLMSDRAQRSALPEGVSRT